MDRGRSSHSGRLVCVKMKEKKRKKENGSITFSLPIWMQIPKEASTKVENSCLWEAEMRLRKVRVNLF